jgi:hypothetical protein
LFLGYFFVCANLALFLSSNAHDADGVLSVRMGGLAEPLVDGLWVSSVSLDHYYRSVG